MSGSSGAAGTQGHGVAGDSIVLEEEIDPNYVPTQDEVREYAKWLGMDLDEDRDLFWIAKEGLKAPLPENWKPCKTVDTDEIYYFNFATGESTWDHPCDEYYRKLYEEEKKKKMTSDKAKHDKSKQQAKKDVNQLLGKDRKKKKIRGTPAEKKKTHQSSPERQVAPNAVPSIFDRKPLPGIGRQAVHGDGDLSSLASSPTHLKTATARDAPTSRFHAHSLVGHRLSQHLSVSAESEESAPEPGDRPNAKEDKSTKRLPTTVDEQRRGQSTGFSKETSEHAAALQELRARHAREISSLERTHEETKRRVEDTHRMQLTSQKRQWTLDAEAQAQAARKTLDEDLQELNAKHTRERSKLERELDGARAQMAEATHRAEEVKEDAIVETQEIESKLAALREAVINEDVILRQAQETSRKALAAEAVHSHENCEAALTRVLTELEEERKHVAEVESQLKEVRNGEATPVVGDVLSASVSEERDASHKALATLKERLKKAMEDNEELSKEVQRLTHAALEGRHDGRGLVDGLETKDGRERQVETELGGLRRALKDADLRLAEVEQLRDDAVKAAKESARTVLDMQYKVDGLELDNNLLVDQVASLRQQSEPDDNVSRDTLKEAAHGKLKEELVDIKSEQAGYEDMLAELRAAVAKHEAQEAHLQQEIQHLKSDLQYSKKEAMRYRGEVETAKERDQCLRNDMETTQLAVQEGRRQIEQLRNKLINDGPSNSVASSLEISRLKRELEQALLDRARAGEVKHDQNDNKFMLEVEELRAQAAAERNQRETLVTEMTVLKTRLADSEGALQTERLAFEASSSDQQIKLEALEATIKLLEAEVAADKQRDEHRRSTAEDSKEHQAVLNLEKKRKTGDAEGPQLLAGECVSGQENATEDGWKAEVVSVTELERAITAASEAMEKARNVADEKAKIEVRLQRAEEQVALLQCTLHETSSKLEDAQRRPSAVKCTPEQPAFPSVCGDELPSAYAPGDAAAALTVVQTPHVDAEERLKNMEQKHATLKAQLSDVTSSRDVQARELQSTKDQLLLLDRRPHIDVSCQTTADQRMVALQRSLNQSQEKLRLALSDLAAKECQALQLRQDVEALTCTANAAAHDALEHAEHGTPSTPQIEVDGLLEREQMLLAELDQARAATQKTLEDYENARQQAKWMERRLAEAESIWRGEKETLLIDLEDAKKVVCSKESQKAMGADGTSRSNERPHADAAEHPPLKVPEKAEHGTTAAEHPPLTVPEKAEYGITAVDETCKRLVDDGSDATSQGLAEELLQQLTKENNLRRESKQQIENKASRSWEKKLEAEKRMLVLAKKVVRRQRERVKMRQHHLATCQNKWRARRHHFGFTPRASSRSRHHASRRGLDEAKRELDGEVNELNKVVGQLRSSKDWLDSREKKIKILETLLQSGGSSSESRQEEGASSTPSSHVPSSCESGTVSERLHALQAMQQELNNDVSDFTVSSVPESGDENLRRRDVWNGVHQSKHCPRHGKVHRNPFQRGKENALPPQATFDTCPHLPASAGFWPPQSCQFYDESHRRKPKKAASKSRFGQHHRQGQTRNRDDLLFADGGVVHECNGTDLSEASEQDLQRWLNRTAVNVGAHVLSNASARGRSNQISKMTVEGQQAQSTVAVHVDWLRTLRQEMALLGGGAPSTKVRMLPPALADVSAAVDALTSPRRVMKTAVSAGARRAQDI